MSLNFDTPIGYLGPIGKGIALRLKKINLKTAEDLLWHFPFRYDDYSQLKKIDQLVGNEIVTIRGKIELINNKRSKIKRTIITEAMVADETGSIRAVWFNQPFLTKNLKPGDEVYLSGKVDFDYYGLQLASPEYEKVRLQESVTTARLVPVYSLTSGITQKQVRYLIKQVLKLADEVEDWLPEKVKQGIEPPIGDSIPTGLLDLPKALKQIHFPDNKQSLLAAQTRLKFDEHFLIQLQSQFIRLEIEQNQAPKIEFKKVKTKNFVDSLPFKLTDDQRKAAWDILQDLEKNKPMNRLLEGEVGSGKTVVATIAMLNVFLNGYQSVLMAPTEILAKQHFETINGLLRGFDVKIGLITRSEKRSNQESRIKNQESSGKKKILNSKFIIHNSNIVIGTHALIQEKVKFKNLGLAIIDEQHRFGVEQRHALVARHSEESRMALRDDEESREYCNVAGVAEHSGARIPAGVMPHFLSMTATPIPRSLSLALYGDLDLSIIKEMPKGRKHIITKVVDPTDRKQAYQFIREQIRQGRQVFVICPLIDPSDKLGYKSVSEEYEKLNKKVFPNLKIGLLHGKLKKADKERVMKDFINNKIKILVSTSVVEVGVDIPNASVMMIEGADRFGLAQLHQFRGRVGRAEYQSYCFLFTELNGQKIRERLESLVNCHNGFDLAERDLQLRGPGEVYGTRQSGLPDFKIASLADIEIIKLAKEEAEKIIGEIDKHAKLKEKLEEYNKKVHLE
jgi:ATP-dependent DNA helicase RecG